MAKFDAILNIGIFSISCHQLGKRLRSIVCRLHLHRNQRGQGSPDKLGGKILNFPEKVIPLCHE